MTKKDFELIAEVLAAARPAGEMARGWTTWCRVVNLFSERLRTENPRFDSERFAVACEYGPEGKKP